MFGFRAKMVKWIATIVTGGSASLLWVVLSSAVQSPEPPPETPQVVHGDDFTLIESETPHADPVAAEAYNDGVHCPPGAHVERPHRHRGGGWWMRGPIRRVVSFPFRWLFCR